MTVFRKLVTVTNVDVTFMLWLVYCLACCPIVLCLVFLAVFDGVRGPHRRRMGARCARAPVGLWALLLLVDAGFGVIALVCELIGQFL